MQNAAWVELLQRIPPPLRDHMVLVLPTGSEIAIQGILRMEEEFVVIRGRTTGTDQGRILFLPYSQIIWFGFSRQVKEVEIKAMFGEGEPEPAQEGAPAESAPAQALAAAPADSTPPAGAPTPAKPAAAPAPPAPPVKASGIFTVPTKSGLHRKAVDKKALLERLRNRTQAGPSGPPSQG
jgi:hypothetical protein